MAAKDIWEVIAVGAALAGPVFWFLAAINMFRMVRHRKPGVPLFSNWFESPFNIMFRPSKLTETGLMARRRVFVGFIGFIGCCGVCAMAFTFAGR